MRGNYAIHYPERPVGWSGGVVLLAGALPYIEKAGAIALKADVGRFPHGAILKNGDRSCFWCVKVHRNHEFRETEQGAPAAFFGGF